MWVHLVAIVGAAVGCAAWALFQLWMQPDQPQLRASSRLLWRQGLQEKPAAYFSRWMKSRHLPCWVVISVLLFLSHRPFAIR